MTRDIFADKMFSRIGETVFDRAALLLLLGARGATATENHVPVVPPGNGLRRKVAAGLADAGPVATRR